MATSDDLLRQLNLRFARLKEQKEVPADFCAALRRIANRRVNEVRAGQLPSGVIAGWITRLPQLSEFLLRSGLTAAPASLEAAVAFLDKLVQMPERSEEDEFLHQVCLLGSSYRLEFSVWKKLGEKGQQLTDGKITWNQFARYAADVFQKAAEERGAEERFPTTMKALLKYIRGMSLPEENEWSWDFKKA